MKTPKPIVRATLALFLLMTANGSTATINFELINATVPFEGMAISNQFQAYPGLTIVGDVGRPYRIDYADKLDRTPSATNWHVLTSLFLPHSPYLYMDVSPASSPERYYRALALP